MIFFLYGEDSYRSREKLKEIKEKFKREVDPSGLNLTSIDGSKIDLDGLNRAFSCLPFLAKRRLVVVEDLFLNRNEEIFDGVQQLLEKNLAEAGESSCLIVFWEGTAGPSAEDGKGKAKMAVKLWRFLSKQKFAAEFQPLKGSQLAGWVIAEFNKNQVAINLDQAQHLIMLVGSDCWSLKNEIDKLSAYALAKGDKTITDQKITEQVSAQFDDNIFNLVDAVSQRQKGLAMKLVTEQIENGANEIYLLSMLNRSFRNLILVKESPPSEHSKLGLHPFVVKKALAQSKRFTSPELKKIYQNLLELDQKIKVGVAKPTVLLDLFLVTI